MERPVDLLERDGDLAAVTALLPKAGAGGALALLGAGAGGGKTAFLRAAAARLEGRADVHWGECDPIGTPRPLGAVMDFAPALVGRAADTLGVDGAGEARFGHRGAEHDAAPVHAQGGCHDRARQCSFFNASSMPASTEAGFFSS